MIKPYTKADQTGRNRKVSSKEFREWKDTESSLQKACEEYLQYFPNIAMIRIPDAAYKAIFASTSLPGWVRPMIARYLKGLPDFVLLKRSESELYCKALCVELKVGKNKQSQGQKKFASIVPVTICRSFEHFKQLVDEL